MIVKVLIFLIILLSSISPKGFKMLTNYEGIYPNPHFFLILFALPIFYQYKIFSIKKCGLKKHRTLVFTLLGISLTYILSLFLSILNSNYTFPIINPLVQTIRMLLSYLVLVPFFLFLRRDLLIYSAKVIVVIAFIHFLFFLYGLLSFYNIVPSNQILLEAMTRDILGYSWTILGYLPKWRGLFEETQIFATFNLSVSYLSYKFYTISNRKIWIILSAIFFLFSIYLISKAVILSLVILLVYFLTNKFKVKPKFIKTIFFIFISLLSSFITIAVFLKYEFSMYTSIYEAGVEHSASFGERIFHIIETFNIMINNYYSFIFGLGPRVYGYIISQKYPDRFTEYSNAVSFFTVFQEVGLLGGVLTIVFIILLLKNISNYTDKIIFLSIFLAYSMQLSFGHSIMLIIFVVITRIQKIF